MQINCRSCKQNKELPLVAVFLWRFPGNILFCANCVDEPTREDWLRMEVNALNRWGWQPVLDPVGDY